MSEIILQDGTYYTPDDKDCIAWQRAYPNCDVYQELLGMAAWCDANPPKRKTRRGAKRFINNWLSSANKRGGSPQAKAAPQSTRSMTMADMMSRDWAK